MLNFLKTKFYFFLILVLAFFSGLILSLTLEARKTFDEIYISSIELIEIRNLINTKNIESANKNLEFLIEQRERVIRYEERSNE